MKNQIRTDLEVYASIQEVSTSRVFIVFYNGEHYYWVRATHARALRGGFPSFSDVLNDMTLVEGGTVDGWAEVFKRFYPNLPISLNGKLSRLIA